MKSMETKSDIDFLLFTTKPFKYETLSVICVNKLQDVTDK